VIYLDTSVLLAHVFVEGRRPSDDLWRETLVSSRLLEYEAWVRVHARGVAASHGDLVEGLLRRIAFVELAGETLARARDPFPEPIRTLDALHLASAAYLRDIGTPISFATYDERLARVARLIDFELYPLP
jgi:predicted nucleic acid-binding protein